MQVEFIGQSVEYLGGYGGDETVESAARTCTQTKVGRAVAEFVAGLLMKGHLSPIEFGFADFLIECDRAIQQELTRHRHFSFNIESTRWINYLKMALRFVTKPPEGMEVPEEAVELLEELCKVCAMVYEAELGMGAPRDYARKALPLATASKMRMAGNLRAWYEMLPKRMGRTAHPEVRELAQRMSGILHDKVSRTIFRR
jgi:thymidylate synthase (FAD)